MIGQGRETQEDNNLFYTCGLIDYISRKTKNVRADVVNQLGRDNICKIYNLADVYHCDNIDTISENFIEECGIKSGEFDNVADCGYSVPSHWDIGKVYRRLIKMVVKDEKTDVIATGDSLSFVVMACQMESKYYDHIVGVCPTDLYELAKAPGRRKNMLKFLIELPIIGTFIYNMAVSRNQIIDAFVNNYYYKGHLVPQKLIHTYYQSAHIGDGGGKYLLASIKSYYTNINIVSAIKKINNSICLIGGKEHPYIEDVINDYKEFNPAIEDAYIPNTTCLPQLEAPDKFVKLVNIFLHA